MTKEIIKSDRVLLRVIPLFFTAALLWVCLFLRIRLGFDLHYGSKFQTIVTSLSYFTNLTHLFLACFSSVYVFYLLTTKRSADSFDRILASFVVFCLFLALVYHLMIARYLGLHGTRLYISTVFHTLVPIGLTFLWFLIKPDIRFNYKVILKWMAYPIGYLVYIVIRGLMTRDYPYPFLRIHRIGWIKFSQNVGLMLLLFLFISSVFIVIHNARIKRDRANS